MNYTINLKVFFLCRVFLWWFLFKYCCLKQEHVYVIFYRLAMYTSLLPVGHTSVGWLNCLPCSIFKNECINTFVFSLQGGTNSMTTFGAHVSAVFFMFVYYVSAMFRMKEVFKNSPTFLKTCLPWALVMPLFTAKLVSLNNS